MTDAVKNLLRPTQVRESQEELSRIDAMLNAPPHIRSKISDPRAMASRRHRLKAELEEFTPKPYSTAEKDKAIADFHRLGEEIKVGMPSDEVMRRNPPGAVQQHQAWERRNKAKVLARKHIGLRLATSGDLDDTLGDAAINVELLRKRATYHDLPLDGAQIPRTTDYHMPAMPDSVVLNDADIELLKTIAPNVANALGTLPAEMRSEVKALLAKYRTESVEPAPAAVPAAAPTPAKAKGALNPAMQRVANLRVLCKKHGINSFRMNVEMMTAALKEKGVEVE